MPIKTFANGDVLTETDLNTYLMNQAVLVFDDSAARSSAIGTATEGMVSYLKDTNSIEYYDSASWVSIQTGALTSSTATAYEIATADNGTYLRFTEAAALTVSTATAFSPGQQVQIFADGTALTIAGGTGVTLGGVGQAGTALTFSNVAQYGAISLFCVDTNNYRVIGNVAVV